MKKLWLLLLALLLTGCAADPLAGAVTALPEEISPPRPEAPETMVTQDMATLWFRYLDEPLLAPESRALALSPDQPLEYALVSALLSGPDVQSTELTALFPAGTRVLSTVRQGRTVFVTLSEQIMDAYPDEPANWRADPYWAHEAPLRRRLCMQSLIATITENCDVDSVQVLVDTQDATTDSLRLRQRYYLNIADEQAPAQPLSRDDSLLLSPGTAMGTILSLCQQRDWVRLEHYIPARDAEALAERLNTLPHLLDFSFTGPTLSGQTATFTLSATVRGATGVTTLSGRVLRLTQEHGLWRVSLDQLIGSLEVSP